MPLRTLLQESAARLLQSETPWLDALVLAEWAAETSRERILGELASPVDEVLDADALRRYRRAIRDRSTGTPVAYILGEREFWSLSFAVGPGVLVPRPETELLVERSLEYLNRYCSDTDPLAIHDCCTGSGVVGIAIAREIAADGRRLDLTLSDISPDALVYARRNAERHLADLPTVRSVVVEGHLLPDSRRHGAGLHLITANPPYLTDLAADQVLSRGWGEPRNALAAGPEGLDLYPELARQAWDALLPGGALMVECGPEQASRLLSLFADTIGYTDGDIFLDAADRPRVVAVRKPVDHGRNER